MGQERKRSHYTWKLNDMPGQLTADPGQPAYGWNCPDMSTELRETVVNERS